MPQTKQEMIAAVTAVNEWSQTRKLKLNAQKSEVIIIDSSSTGKAQSSRHDVTTT